MQSLPEKRPWSPYIAGTGLGVLSWITFLFMDKALGVSTTMVQAAGSAAALAAPDHVRDNAYLAKYLVGKPAFEWQFALVLALALGAFLAARWSRQSKAPAVPAIWRARFGESRTRRYLGAFAGGLLVLFGARMAGGCTSGHALSGGLQLALSGWSFMVAMFATGIATAFLIFRRGGPSHV